MLLLKTSRLSLTNLCLIFITTIYSNLNAQVNMPEIFSDNMILQRNQAVNIWGEAAPGENVKLTFLGNQYKTKANKEGNWKVRLKPMVAGGPYDMSISGTNTILIKNILVGDVWLCGGQSNMELNLLRVQNAAIEIAHAKYPEIRYIKVPRHIAYSAESDIRESEWLEVQPDQVENLSAVAYFFARHLYEKYKIPIGLISSNWGGTVIESWMSEEAIVSTGEFSELMNDLNKIDLDSLDKGQMATKKRIQAYVQGDTDGLIYDEAIWAKDRVAKSHWHDMELPGVWEKSLLKGVDGIVWFRKSLDLSEAQVNSVAALHLGKIDDSDISWINGTRVGSTNEQHNAERVYPITKEILKPGKNIITVRVEDLGGEGGFRGESEDMFLKLGNKQISLAGTWKFRVSPQNFHLNINNNEKNRFPTTLYNGMIQPIQQFTISGVIWYQGESNVSRADQYQQLFPLMIEDWRKQFNQAKMPFLFVQLASHHEELTIPAPSDWAELREAQSMALSLPYTAMAVTIDIGDTKDIHPRNKQDVGKRLALAAEHVFYGEEVVYSGPVFKSMEVKGNKVYISFDHIGSGLMVKHKYGYLMGFQIAGPDMKFQWAQAEVSGDQVVVKGSNIVSPFAVRYGWENNPESANLFNKEGLPAAPFRTYLEE